MNRKVADIAVISDIHDGKAQLDAVLSDAVARGLQEAIILGDFCAPPTLRQLLSSGMRLHCIFGNNDGDRAALKEIALNSGGQATLARGEFAILNFGDADAFVTHYPDIARPVAHSGQFNTVLYGHDHQRHIETLSNGTLLLNPGEVWGWLRGMVSYAVWHVDTNTADIVELGHIEDGDGPRYRNRR